MVLRGWKVNGEDTTYYLYDGDTLVAEIVDGALIPHVWGADGLISRGDVFYLYDPLGNVAHRLADDGTVLSNDLYDAWGQCLASLEPDGDTYEAENDPYGYNAQSGYITDYVSELILCKYRYYDPVLGRWITRDPIGTLGGINIYCYSSNNSVNSCDPSGLSDGIHWFPQECYESGKANPYQFSKDVIILFRNACTGPLSTRHDYSNPHHSYNQIVGREAFASFLKSRGLLKDGMTINQATIKMTVQQAQQYINIITNGGINTLINDENKCGVVNNYVRYIRELKLGNAGHATRFLVKALTYVKNMKVMKTRSITQQSNNGNGRVLHPPVGGMRRGGGRGGGSSAGSICGGGSSIYGECEWNPFPNGPLYYDEINGNLCVIHYLLT